MAATIVGSPIFLGRMRCARAHCVPSIQLQMVRKQQPMRASFVTAAAAAAASIDPSISLEHAESINNSFAPGSSEVSVGVVEAMTGKEALDVSVNDGGGGIGPGGDEAGGSGGGGNNGGGHGDGTSDQDGFKSSKPLSMSQKLTLVYAALVGFGGLIGFLKSGSTKSLFSGAMSASILFYVYTQLPVNPVAASSIGAGISLLLLVVMGSRFKASGKVFPAGVVSAVSFIMTGGYVHGIMRSKHHP